MSDTEAGQADEAPLGAPQDDATDHHAVDTRTPDAAAGPRQGGESTHDPDETAADQGHDPSDDEDNGEAHPSWWHSSHPTFAGLVGFFVGVAYVIVVPGLYAAILGLLFSDSTAKRLFPLAGVALLVPLGMLIPRKTRRFAQFMLFGVVSTALVIGLTTAVVLWVMFQIDG